MQQILHHSTSLLVSIILRWDCSENPTSSERQQGHDLQISINCLEYVTIIISYCTAITTLLDSDITDDPHPVVLCVTDNVSAKIWTIHTCKKSIIGRALARFFCGLLIGSNVGINSKWISIAANKIADNISRIKNLTLQLLLLSITISPNFNRTMQSWNIVVSSSQVQSCS